MRRILLARLSDVIYRFRWLIIAVAFSMTAVAGYWVKDIPIDTSFYTMLNHEHPEVKRFIAATDEFGASSNIILAVRGADIENVKKFADSVAPKIRALPDVRTVIEKAPLDFISKYGLLLAPKNELEKIPELLEEGGSFFKKVFERPTLPVLLQSINEQLRNSLEDGGDLSQSDSIMEMSEGLTGLLKAAVIYARKGKKAGNKPLDEAIAGFFMKGGRESLPPEALGDGYIVSPDGSMLLISIRMEVDAFKMDMTMTEYLSVKNVVMEELKLWPGIEAGFAGIAPMAQEDQEIILGRIFSLSKLTLLIMALIFWWMSRNVWSPLLITLTLGMSIIWTFTIVRLVFGFVNMLSATFAIMLFGLGIDFAIHIMTRHNEGIHNGLDTKSALRGAVSGGGVGILTGGLTTAFAFLAMNVAEFKGAHQLGTTTGSGILCCLLVMMIVFPALIAAVGKSGAGRVPQQESPLLHRWAEKVTARPKTVLIIFALITVFFGYFVTRLEMVFDLDRILTKGLPAIELKNEIEEKFGTSMDFAMLVADDLDQARQFTKQARENKAFKRVDSITDFLAEDQADKLPILEKIRSLSNSMPAGNVSSSINDAEWKTFIEEGKLLEAILTDLILLAELSDEENIERSLRDLRKEVHTLMLALLPPGARGKMAYFQGLLGERLLRIHDILSHGGEDGRITIDVLPDAVKNVYVGKSGKYLVAAFPAGNQLKRANMESSIKAARDITAESTGMILMVRRNVVEAQEDFPEILAAVIITLFILLSIDFRNIVYTLLAIIPVVMASIIGLGVMYLSGKMLTPITLIAFPLIYGIGIDYAVHIMHRYKEENDVVAACARTGRAIGLTSITTIIGFSILMFTSHNGLISLGFLITIGVALCFVTTVTILPATLVLLKRE